MNDIKKEEGRTHGACPKCGNTIVGHPAVSRTDNDTLICADCGTREALESLGVDREEQERIVDIIHSHAR